VEVKIGNRITIACRPRHRYCAVVGEVLCIHLRGTGWIQGPLIAHLHICVVESPILLQFDSMTVVFGNARNKGLLDKVSTQFRTISMSGRHLSGEPSWHNLRKVLVVLLFARAPQQPAALWQSNNRCSKHLHLGGSLIGFLVASVSPDSTQPMHKMFAAALLTGPPLCGVPTSKCIWSTIPSQNEPFWLAFEPNLTGRLEAPLVLRA